MLKHYYSMHGLTPGVEWLPIEFFAFDDEDTIVGNVLKENPDVLALSVFIWNESLQHNIARRIKQKNPDTLIVMGGPQLIAHKDPDFFNRHPYIDYVTYGDGEKPFQQILDFHSGALTGTDGFVNICMKDQDGAYKKFDYELLSDQEYYDSSPYLSQKEFIQQHIDRLLDRGVRRSEIMIAVEFARGCMYKCSFCDWGQMLTKKVKRRKTRWQEEIEFFKELDVAIRETDANFGQWPQDFEIYDYAKSLYDPNRNFKFLCWNIAKLKKDAQVYFTVQNALTYKTRIGLSFQDINEDVLQKMDRPSLNWEDQKKILLEVKESVGPEEARKLWVRFMLGTPGQSFESLADSIFKIWLETDVFEIRLSHWFLLPNSPGADPLYNKMHKLKWVKAYEQTDSKNPVSEFSDLENIYRNFDADSGLRHRFYEGTAIYSTATMDLGQMIACEILIQLLVRLHEKFHYIEPNRRAAIWNGLKKKAWDSAQTQFALIEPLVVKYNKLLIGSWDQDQKKLYSYWID